MVFRCRKEQREAEKKARDDQFRAELNAKQKIKNDFNSQYGHLGVANSSEIDEQVRLLEFRQQHESLSINEEKALLKQIKQLQVNTEDAGSGGSLYCSSVQSMYDNDALSGCIAESYFLRHLPGISRRSITALHPKILQAHLQTNLKTNLTALWKLVVLCIAIHMLAIVYVMHQIFLCPQDSREAVTAYSQWAAQDKADRDAKQAFKKQQAAESEATRNNRVDLLAKTDIAVAWLSHLPNSFVGFGLYVFHTHCIKAASITSFSMQG